MKELCEEESLKITDISTILYSILLKKRLYDFKKRKEELLLRKIRRVGSIR